MTKAYGMVVWGCALGLSLVACGSDDSGGGDRASGSADGAGVDAEFAAITEVVADAAGDRCPAGGHRIDYGVDRNMNDELDADEVNGTTYVCNGVDGKDGKDGKDGAAGEDGGGTQGGYNALVRSAPALLESECLRIDSGIDDGTPSGTAGDGVLQDGEVDSSEYLACAYTDYVSTEEVALDGAGGATHRVYLLPDYNAVDDFYNDLSYWDVRVNEGAGFIMTEGLQGDAVRGPEGVLEIAYDLDIEDLLSPLDLAAGDAAATFQVLCRSTGTAYDTASVVIELLDASDQVLSSHTLFDGAVESTDLFVACGGVVEAIPAETLVVRVIVRTDGASGNPGAEFAAPWMAARGMMRYSVDGAPFSSWTAFHPYVDIALDESQVGEHRVDTEVRDRYLLMRGTAYIDLD